VTDAALRIVVDVIALALAFGFVGNAVLFFANLKLYTEIMKEKSQRERRSEDA